MVRVTLTGQVMLLMRLRDNSSCTLNLGRQNNAQHVVLVRAHPVLFRQHFLGTPHGAVPLMLVVISPMDPQYCMTSETVSAQLIGP